ncbi:hypothetical protein [Streptomyces sp. 35G-GA-8]|uniref:hypothetical protein n=1 Tax=Streptomyces sp. 35G-GA-8 TaxID=2939434 RepID=UPI00201E7DB3|nr:hypothetical protein [Streptomyces sp. 35G-GA-8]MCL7382544.1 hypothetical protein [Streptomyces sp. 35G-GA-8]
MADTMAALRYDVPGTDDRPTRTVLARLLSLYSTARDYDRTVIDLIASLVHSAEPTTDEIG